MLQNYTEERSTDNIKTDSNFEVESPITPLTKSTEINIDDKKPPSIPTKDSSPPLTKRNISKKLDFEDVPILDYSSDPERLFNSWSSELKLYLLNNVTDQEVISSIKENFCNENSKKFIVFYSNPMYLGVSNLSVDLEIQSVLIDSGIPPTDTRIVPFTNKTIFFEKLETNKPDLFLFSGHAEKQYIILGDQRNQAERILYSDISQSIKSAYDYKSTSFNPQNLKPKAILLFACHTYGFVTTIKDNPWYEDIVIIGWKTVVEDTYARIFGNKILKHLSDVWFDIKEEQIIRAFEDSVHEMKTEYTKIIFGDPSPELSKWGKHIELFNVNLKEFFETFPPVKKEELGKGQLPSQIDIRTRIKGCPHCYPPQIGVPFLYIKKKDGDIIHSG